MPIIRINQLPDGSGSLSSDDILLFMDDPSGTGVTKKISISEVSGLIGGGGGINFEITTVDLHNGGVQSAQVLQFTDDGYQSVITGPPPPSGNTAQRLIIQGQRAQGGGEGGDVYFWGGDSQVNGGDIKIYAGDADSGSSGYGGYVNIDGGNGYDQGGNIGITAGNSTTQGGNVTISAGSPNGTVTLSQANTAQKLQLIDVSSDAAELRYLNGYYSSEGDAKSSTMVLRRETTTTGWYSLYTNAHAGTNSIIYPNNSSILLIAKIVGRVGSNVASFILRGSVFHNGSNWAIAGSMIKESYLSTNFIATGVDVRFDTSTGSIQVEQGSHGLGNVKWVCVLDSVIITA